MRGRIVRTVLLTAVCGWFGGAANALCLVWDPSAPDGYRDGAAGYRSIPVEAEFNHAFVVLTATVRSVHYVPNGDLPMFMKTEVVPVDTIKGPQLGPFTIFDEVDSGRFDMDAGKTYLLFVSTAGKRSVVDSCGWSDELSVAGETLQRVRALASDR